MPIELILGGLQASVALYISYKLNISSKRRPEDINVKYFFYTFILLSFVFLFSTLSVAGLINLRVDYIFSSLNIIGRGLILLAIMLFAYIPLNILKNEFWKRFFPLIVFTISSVSVLLSFRGLIDYPETPIQEIGGFILRLHRSDIYSQAGIIIIGVAAFISLIASSINYIKVVLPDFKDGYVFKRSLLTLGAALFFCFGIAFNYLVTIKYPATGRIIGEILYLVALLFFLAGVLYKDKDSSRKNNKK